MTFLEIIRVRAITDTGSQTSFITEKCVSRLSLPRIKISSAIQGIGEIGINSQLGYVSLSVRSKYENIFNIPVNAIILSCICSDLPRAAIANDNSNHIKNVKLVDLEVYKPRSIDLLLGSALFQLIIRNGTVFSKNNEPVVINTIFGFILGKSENNQFDSNIQTLLC